MTKHRYKITLETPLGRRYGTLEISVCSSKISGCLDVFQNRQPVTGVLYGDGACRLSGKFVTLMSEVPYQATGCIGNDSVELTLIAGNGTFKITGIAAGWNSDKEENHELY